MPVIPQIAESHPKLTAWRRELHAHPETAFEEKFTSDFVAARLTEFGLPVHRGLATTGVVATLTAGEPSRNGNRAIGLRADMDALDIEELTGLPYRSTRPGKMHACGHDGHTTMLLGAAEYLAKTKSFSGTVHFIFQPAEEAEGGGRVMVEEGLFEKFPTSCVFGMHNWPGMPVGKFAMRSGPMMAAFDVFEIIIRGRGAHAAMPHAGVDPLVIAAQLVSNFQAIVGRQVNPVDSAVVSVTQIHGGDTWNVIPETAMLRGTVRTFRAATQDAIEASIRRMADGICAAHGATAELRYERRYPTTINTAMETDWAADAAADVAGDEQIDRNPIPCMGSEDFAFMLQKKPGSYIWIGNGPTEGNRTLHNPHYDFNDEVLPIGASYWARLVERLLPK